VLGLEEGFQARIWGEKGELQTVDEIEIEYEAQ